MTERSEVEARDRAILENFYTYCLWMFSKGVEFMTKEEIYFSIKKRCQELRFPDLDIKKDKK